MKAVTVTFLASCCFIAASAQYQKNFTDAEERMARNQIGNPNYCRSAMAQKMTIVAEQHVGAEREVFAKQDIDKAEKLYMRGSRMLLSGEESKKQFDSVVSLYPQLNRAGCAQLYRAQQEVGGEKERLLKDCLARFSNCYYLDGAQVGPLATYQLACYYWNIGRYRDADEFFRQLRKDHPEAVGHDGRLLVDKINELH